MIAASEAQRLILEATEPGPVERCPLREARGRILREPVRADRPSPPYDRVVMDGFALSSVAWQEGRRDFAIQATIPAGQPPPELRDPTHVLGVMTGGGLPSGCDLVVPIEWCAQADGQVRVAPAEELAVEAGLFIHRVGSDGPAGRAVLTAGTKLGPAELAIAAAEGALELVTDRTPRIVLVTTGSEVVPPDSEPEAWQIRGSHAAALASLFAGWGPVAWRHEHVKDEADALRRTFSNALEDTDMLLVTGGVSRGQWDLVPDALGDAGVEKILHRVAQRPGKPLWFGRGTSALVFGLPGNPVSALCCARRYAWPAIDRWSGRDEEGQKRASLTEAFSPLPALTYFLPVRRKDAGVAPAAPSHSGDLHALAGTDGFVECPPGSAALPEGTVLDYYDWSR